MSKPPLEMYTPLLEQMISQGMSPDVALAMAEDFFDTRSKKVRGMARKSLAMIEAMTSIAEKTQPITGRGIGYKLFAAGMISSMSRQNMQCVYRLLKEARERGMVPWSWIVDETRELEQTSSWKDPAAFVRTVARSYRLDFWNQQPVRVEVWSEKGTIRGVLAPVLEKFGVGFRVMHGFSGATPLHPVAQDDDGRQLIVLYIGDYDPSGLYMSEKDLPNRLAKYGGDHVSLRRIALLRDDLAELPFFAAADKKGDPRFKWFSENFGQRCWELDAMDPNDLRDRVEDEIQALIEPEAWERCSTCQKAEQESLRSVLDSWRQTS